MGNINDKLEYMNGTKLDIRDALIEQKQEVPPSTPFRAYGDIIRGLDTTDTSDATATSNDILDGKTAYVNKEKLTGTMVDNGELTYTPSTSSQSIPAGYTSGGTIAGVDSSIDNNIQSYNIKAGVNILGVEGNVEPDKPDQEKTVNPSTSTQEVTADTGYELAKVTVNAIETETTNVKSTTTSQTVTPTAGKFINEITVEPIELESKVVTPTTSQQVITPSQDKDGIGQVTVSGVDASIDNNIVSENIKANTAILGVQGKTTVVDTEDANAVANKMISGYSAYVNGEKINGSIVPRTSSIELSSGVSSMSTSSSHPNQIRIGFGYVNGTFANAPFYVWYNQTDLLRRLGISAGVLKTGIQVLNITGNFTSDANATSNDILENKTAYVNGNKVTGTLNLDTEIANQTALITQLEELVQSKSVIQPVFENGNMSSLNSAVADAIKPVIQAFTDYLDEQQELNTPYLNEPITIYTPDENMQYFAITKNSDNKYRIFWSKSKYAFLKHNSTTQYRLSLLQTVGVRSVTNEITIHNANWDWSLYATGIDTNLLDKNDAYSSNNFNTIEDLISAISNPNAEITYTHPQNSPSYGVSPISEYITNIFIWENSVSASSNIMDTIVTTNILSNNVTILPLNS